MYLLDDRAQRVRDYWLYHELFPDIVNTALGKKFGCSLYSTVVKTLNNQDTIDTHNYMD